MERGQSRQLNERVDVGAGVSGQLSGGEREAEQEQEVYDESGRYGNLWIRLWRCGH